MTAVTGGNKGLERAMRRERARELRDGPSEDPVDRMLGQTEAMLEWASDKGKTPPASAVRQLTAARQADENDELEESEELEGLVAAHRTLSRHIRPARPDTVRRLMQERQRRNNSGPIKHLYFALGPLPVIRNLIVASVLFVLAFVLFAASPSARDLTSQPPGSVPPSTASAVVPGSVPVS